MRVRRLPLVLTLALALIIVAGFILMGLAKPAPLIAMPPAATTATPAPGVPSPSIEGGAYPPAGAQPSPAGNVTIHFINVSLGDAILVQAAGENILIDGGSRADAPFLLNYLSAHNVTHIDAVSASNHDEDHMGGLIAVLNAFNVTAVWDSNSSKDTKVYRDFISRARVVPNFTIVGRGAVFSLSPIVNFTVLGPKQPLEFTNENDVSVVLKLSVGRVSVLFAGDCEGPCEDSILASGLNVSSTFLKAGHHGSRTSTSARFLDAVSPKAALLLAGEVGHAKYGHPHAETLAKLDVRKIPYYITRLNGTMILDTDGICFILSPQLGVVFSGCAG